MSASGRMSSVVGSATPFVVDDVVVVRVPAAFRPRSLNSVPSTCTPATTLPLRQLLPRNNSVVEPSVPPANWPPLVSVVVFVFTPAVLAKSATLE